MKKLPKKPGNAQFSGFFVGKSKILLDREGKSNYNGVNITENR
jgi:hypothetical protein